MITVGILTVSTLGAAGQREDTSGEAIREIVTAVPLSAEVADQRIVPDDRAAIESVLRHWADDLQLNLVLTTGGTGLSPTDVTPEATLAVATKEMPGFGEQMRRISLTFVPTAILSRQVAVIRDKALVINLPGQPKAIAETLEGLPGATPPVPGIFTAVPYCIDLIGGPYLETDEALCKAFRPKSAIRPPRPVAS